MMTFEEFLKAKEEYHAFVTGQSAPEAAPVENPAEEPVEEAAPAPETPAELPANGPAEDYRKELNEIRAELVRMAKALSPSLGDVDPVGIDDVVKNFFEE